MFLMSNLGVIGSDCFGVAFGREVNQAVNFLGIVDDADRDHCLLD